MSQQAHSKLSRKQSAAIAALIASASVEKAATICGVSRATLTRWMNDRAFHDTYERETRQLVEYATGRVRAGVDDALATLQRNMGEHAPPSVQVAAAKAWLDHLRSLYPVKIAPAAPDDGEGLFEWMRVIAKQALLNVIDITPMLGTPALPAAEPPDVAELVETIMQGEG